ncbi:MAG TPA: HAD family phosphatase [Solirubrobacteraceae bacterium]|jgi:HAD superfamily hydrolase (TIGR01509 family)
MTATADGVGGSIAAVCFDLDGTLVDSERVHWQAYRRVLQHYGADVELDEYRRRFIAVEGGAEWASERWALPIDGPTLRAKKAVVYRELIGGGVAPMPGARDCITRLHGLWRLAVVTNSSRDEAAALLAPLGVVPLLDAIITRENYGAPKPAPDGYLAAAAALGCPPAACVAVEDTPRGVRSARAAGLRALAVPGDLMADQDFTVATRRLPGLDALTPAFLLSLENGGH